MVDGGQSEESRSCASHLPTLCDEPSLLVKEAGRVCTNMPCAQLRCALPVRWQSVCAVLQRRP